MNGMILKNHLIGAIQAERGKKDPDWKVVQVLEIAAAKEELRLAMKWLDNMDGAAALVNIRSAQSLLEDAYTRKSVGAHRIPGDPLSDNESSDLRP